jgi:methyl-accepting chemotaxis protein
MLARSLILRLMMPLALTVLLVGTLLALGTSTMMKVAAAQDAVDRETARTLALTDLRSISRSLQRDALNLVIEPDATERDGIAARFDKRMAEFTRKLDALPASTPPAERREMALYDSSQRKVLVGLGQLRRIAAARRGAALAIFRGQVRPAERRASTIADDLIDRLTTDTGELRLESARIERDQSTIMVASSIVLLLLAIAAGVYVTLATVIRPLNQIRMAMEALASGETGQPVPHTRRPDAIGTMARAIEVFRAATRERDTLRLTSETAREEAAARDHAAAEARRRADAEAAHRREMEEQRRALLEQLADAVQTSLSTVNDKLRTSATRLSRSADEVAGHAQASGQEAQETARVAANVGRELVVGNEQTLALARTAAILQQQAQGAAEAVQTAAARSRAAAARMAGLSSYADRVGEIMELIKKVAKQSRMLALNATIEAARAGEAGRGFATVANEMKGLAARTAAAADHVEAEVAAIRSVARDGSAALAEMEEAVAQIDRDAGLVTDAMSRQGAATDEIARGMQAALDHVGAVGTRMNRLGAGARSTGEVAGTLLADAEALAADAERVDSALRALVARIRAAADGGEVQPAVRVTEARAA